MYIYIYTYTYTYIYIYIYIYILCVCDIRSGFTRVCVCLSAFCGVEVRPRIDSVYLL